jgi:hypothetical protein
MPSDPSRDCISYEISTQDVCLEVHSQPQRDARWYQGLSLQIDQEILGGRVIAYQIRWFNGNWSTWFVPGVNDIDHKYNPVNNTMRRMWSYFDDHEHRYILCKAGNSVSISKFPFNENSMSISPSRIKQFYEETFILQLRQLEKEGTLFPWLLESPNCIGYLQLGSLELNSESEEYQPTLDYVRVKRLPSTIPINVLDSFNHHYLTSQTRLVDIYVVRTPVDGEDTYSILLNGYVDDGWDQETKFLEVYDSQENIIGSCRGVLDLDCSIKWVDRAFTIDDYDFGYEEIQIWSDKDVEYVDASS